MPLEAWSTCSYDTVSAAHLVSLEPLQRIKNWAMPSGIALARICSSIAVITHYGQGNLQRKVFNLAMVSGHDDRIKKQLTTHGFIHNREAERELTRKLRPEDCSEFEASLDYNVNFRPA